MSAPRWEAWTPAAFKRAKDEKRPVLLAMSGLDPLNEVPAAVLDRFVRVRAFWDRPDVCARYFPLAPQGLLVLDHAGAVVAATEQIEPARLAEELERAAARKAAGDAPASPSGPVWTGAVGAPEVPALSPERPALLAAEIKALPRVLNPFAMDLLLEAAAEWGDEDAAAIARREFAALRGNEFVGAGPLSEWTRLFADGAAALGDAGLREATLRHARELRRRYFDELAGGLRHLTDEEAAEDSVPPAVCFADDAALGALALLRASAVTGDAVLRETAEKLLVFLERELYDPLLGVIHYRPASGEAVVYGLLQDNALAALAFTEAFMMTGRKGYREFADQLVRFMFQELWDRERGGFLDRVPQGGDVGLLAQPRRPVIANAHALEALWRMHHLKGNMNYRRWFEWGLKSMSAAAQGADAAALARVQDLHQRGRMDLELVGRVGEAGTDALLAELHRHYAPRRIVSFVDPDDQDYILAHKLARKEEPQKFPRVFGCVDLRPVADAGEPSGVAAVVAAVRKR